MDTTKGFEIVTAGKILHVHVTGKLTKEEYEIAMKHTENGIKLLENEKNITEESLIIVIQHHLKTTVCTTNKVIQTITILGFSLLKCIPTGLTQVNR